MFPLSRRFVTADWCRAQLPRSAVIDRRYRTQSFYRIRVLNAVNQLRWAMATDGVRRAFHWREKS